MGAANLKHVATGAVKCDGNRGQYYSNVSHSGVVPP